MLKMCTLFNYGTVAMVDYPIHSDKMFVILCRININKNNVPQITLINLSQKLHVSKITGENFQI